MIRYNHHHEITPKGYIYRAIIALASILILVICIPHGKSRLKRYDNSLIGKYWLDNAVYAKQNIPILKADSVIKSEEESIRKGYSPIFIIESKISAEQQAALRTFYTEQLSSSVPYYYLTYVNKKINEVYEAGIVSVEDHEELKTQQRKNITKAEQNTATSIDIDKIYTPKRAYEFIMQTEDSARYKPVILQKFNLSKFLTPNLTYDRLRSDQELKSKLEKISMYYGEIEAGKEIVHRGQIINEETLLLLQSLEKVENKDGQSTPEMAYSQLGGQCLYVTIIVLCLLVFFNQFRSDYLEKASTIFLIVMMVMLFPLLTYQMAKHGLNVYMIPYCILPIFLRVFLDSRTAFITHLASILLSAIALSSPFNFVVVQLVAGMVAIYSLKELSQRSELFRAVILVMLASLAIYLCFDLINLTFLSQTPDYSPYLFILANGVLLLVSYLLLFPFERIFGFTSNVTLVELSNTNSPILRDLSEKASGTFQHCMQVANLAGEVANKVGANSQLVRTGALYHDIGKMANPTFFTENQNGVNPHNSISYEKSAELIIRHVKEGLEIADKNKLPKIIRDFIATHHGTSKAKYFYISYKNEHPDEEIDESKFTYPGPNPQTLEQAILMMADAVEAASRSLKEYTEENVNSLVDRIIDDQVREGAFNVCPITFEHINTAKDVFKKKLMTIYHTRISYPELNKKAKE